MPTTVKFSGRGEEAGISAFVADRNPATAEWTEEQNVTVYSTEWIWVLNDAFAVTVGHDGNSSYGWSIWDGENWADGPAIPNLSVPRCVWGTSATNLFIVGNNQANECAIWKYDGVTVTEVFTLPSLRAADQFRRIHGVVGSRYFVIGERDLDPLAYYSDDNGATWSDLSFGGALNLSELRALYSYTAGECAVSGSDGINDPYAYKHDGSSWVSLGKVDLTNGAVIYDLWGNADDNLFAVGYEPTGGGDRAMCWDYDGISWTKVWEHPTSLDQRARSITSIDGTTLWLVGYSTTAASLTFVYRSDDAGATWAKENITPSSLDYGESIWATDAVASVIDGGGPLGGLMPRQRGSNNAARATLLGSSNGRGGLPIPYNAKLLAAIAARKK